MEFCNSGQRNDQDVQIRNDTERARSYTRPLHESFVASTLETCHTSQVRDPIGAASWMTRYRIQNEAYGVEYECDT